MEIMVNNSLEFKGVILLVVIILLLIGCGKDPTDPEPATYTQTSTFPLTIDSRWEYEGMYFTVPYNDPSLADTMWFEVSRRIIGLDSLPELGEFYVCDDSTISYQNQFPDTFIYRQWLTLEDEKLMMFAHENYIPGQDPTPYVFDSPRVLLDFPLDGEKAWISWESDYFREDRSLEGVEYIELPFGWQYCDVVNSILVQTTTNNIYFSKFDWFSNDGLMRSETDHGYHYIYGEQHVLLDSSRAYEFWELVDMEILEP
jgi:hypothetical protein